MTTLLLVNTLTTMSENPYAPEPEKYEQKQWLYEQYWGQLKSQNKIVAGLDVSRKKIRMEMNEHGIPRRTESAAHPQSNPFEGFYGPTESPPAPENTQKQHSEPDPDWEPDADPAKWGDANSRPLMWVRSD